jgi:hypothetical protein
MVDQCAKWKILAKYQLTLRMHSRNLPNPARPAEEKTDKARTSSLIPSDPFKPVCCQYPTNLRVIPGVPLGEWHSETVVVGGDAVATRRFLGIPPPLAIPGARDGRPVIFLRDLIGAAMSDTWPAASWRESRASEKSRGRGSCRA